MKAVRCSVITSVCVAVLSLATTTAQGHPDEVVAHFSDTPQPQASATIPRDKDGKPLWSLNAGIPFFGSPVHEEQTVASINLSQVHDRSYRVDYDDAYIQGVFWPDDPEGMLCPNCSKLDPTQFDRRWGIDFGLHFAAAKKRAVGDATTPPYFFQAGDGLLARSHFGDLQFMHAMAARDGEKAGETLDKILAWNEFLYKVATRRIDHRLRLQDIPVARVRELFAGDASLRDRRIADLFRGPAAVRQVALGAMLHTLQDSYAGGHAQRVPGDRRDDTGAPVFSRGTIVRFHSYANQDSKKHAADDQRPQGLERVSLQADDNPVSVGARLLLMAYRDQGRGAPWEEVRTYLETTVFRIEDRNALAGPGAAYARVTP